MLLRQKCYTCRMLFMQTIVAFVALALSCPCPPSPAPAPPINANACAATITNGQALPACVSDTFFPDTPGGLYRRLISNSARIDPQSAAMVRAYFGTTRGSNDNVAGLMWHVGVGQRIYDYSRPLYTAKSTDVLVNINCSLYCAIPSVRAYIPANALAAGGSDKHLTLLQPSHAFIDTWGFANSPPYFNGQNLTASTLAVTNIDGTTYSNNDVLPAWMKIAPTAGGMVDGSGSVSLSALQAGVINHELYIVLTCTASAWVFPASQTARVCIDNRVAIPTGSLLQYTLSDQQIAASSMSRDSKIIATALHDYGGRVSDTGGVAGLAVQLESQESFWSYGSGPDPFIAYAMGNGWQHVTNGNVRPAVDRYVHLLGDLDLPAHIRVLAPGN